MKKESTLIIACLISAAVGVIIGMLLSDDTRKSFQETTKKIGEGLISKFSDKQQDINNDGAYSEDMTKTVGKE